MRKSCVVTVDSLWKTAGTYPQAAVSFHNMGKNHRFVRSLCHSSTHAFTQPNGAVNRSSTAVVHVFHRLNNKNNK
jgi:hypothetical protein